MHRVESLVSGIMSWALSAIVAVLFNFIAFLSSDERVDWIIWVVVTDMFLAISGILRVCGSLIIGAVITQRMDAAIVDNNYDKALEIAIKQVAAGAHIIDINMDDGLIDSKAAMTKFVNVLVTEPEASKVPLHDRQFQV